MLRSAWPALRSSYTVSEGARHVYRPSWTTSQHSKKGPGYSFSTTPEVKYTPFTVEEPGEDGRRALYYHLLPKITHSGHSSISGVWALSFSQTPPPNGSPNHKTVLGVLPATQAKAGDTATGDPSPAPSIGNFEQNPHFVQTLHQAIRHVLDTHADETLEAEAKARGEGWMHICGQFTLSCFYSLTSSLYCQISASHLL
jgi:hypothetical protein